MKFSLCMIVRDEEALLPRCLASAEGLADEIVIVDTGSSDNTKQAARAFTQQVYDFAWQDDFSAARNFAFSRATGDYLFWLDADDVFTEEERKRFPAVRELFAHEGPDFAVCPYRSGGLVYERERFLRNTAEARWQGRVHECIPPFGKRMHLGLTVTHLPAGRRDPGRNLRIYLKWAEEERLTGRALFYFGRELFEHGLFLQAEATFREVLRGEGWYVNKIEACRLLAACREAAGDAQGALGALFESFRYGEPRAAVLYAIGRLLKESDPRAAVYWFEAALRCPDHAAEGDFEQPECYGILPALELVCLYHVLGEPSKSLEMHKKSEALAPDHPSVIFNKKFFGE